MQEKRNTKVHLFLFAMGLLFIIGATLIVLLQKDDMYLVKLKGDGNTRVITKDIRVGPVPFFFWGALLLYTWLTSLWSRVPIKSLLKPMVITGLIIHQALLLLQLELQYGILKESFGGYTSALYYWYMRGVFLLLLFFLGIFSARWWKKFREHGMEDKDIITKMPYSFLFLALLVLSFSHPTWILAGIIGFLGGWMGEGLLTKMAVMKNMALHRFPYQRVILTILCLVAFLAVIGFSFRLIAMHGENFRSAGDDNWSTPAESLAKNMFNPEIWNMDIALGYIVFLGVIYKIFGINFYAVGVIQAFLAACSVLLLYSIAKKLFSESIALIAAALFALNGPFLNILSTFSTEGPYTFLILLMFWSLLQYKEKLKEQQRWYYLALAAVAFAMGELIKPQTLLFFLPILLWFWFTQRENRWKVCAVFVLIAILFTIPFAMYDFALNNKVTILHAGGARAFTNTMGRALTAVGINPYQLGLLEYVGELVEHKEQTVEIYSNYIPKFFIRVFFSDWFGIFDLLLIHRHSLFAYQLRFYAYLAIMIGIFLVWKKRKEAGERWKDQLLVFSFIPYTTAIILLVSSSKVRYRIPLDPFFIILMAVTLSWLFYQLKKGKTEEKKSAGKKRRS